MARRTQTILKRDERGKVVYDDKGRPVRERVVKASPSSFRRDKPSPSGAVVTRLMSDDEKRRYGCAEPLSKEERRRIGQAALLMTADERRRYHD